MQTSKSREMDDLPIENLIIDQLLKGVLIIAMAISSL